MMNRIGLAWNLDKGMEDPHAVFAFRTDILPGNARHTHRFHEFIFLESGQARQLHGDLDYPFTPGELYFLPAGDWHIAQAKTATKVIVVNFYELVFARSIPAERPALALLRLLMEKARNHQPKIQLQAASGPRVRGILENLVAECEEQNPGWLLAAKSQLLALMLLLQRETALGQSLGPTPVLGSKRSDRMEKVLSHIRQRLAEPLRIREVAREAGMGHSVFCESFRAHTGHTFVQYVNRLRINESCRLLTDTDQTLPLIAERCGFPCFSHFFSVFRSLTGHTPREFRKLHTRRLT